jgi:tetratricopeptide (TPR) repeat protein
MKKITFLIAAMLFITTAKTNAQDDAKRECTIKYNLFKGDFKSKKYDDAYTNWIYLMDNCQDLSVNIYKFGAELAEDVRKDQALAKRVYEQRLQYFPTKNPAKVHSDYATYLAKNKLAEADVVFSILEKAYNIDPTKMGVKNLYKYFQGMTDRNKDTNPQKVFDTYDDVLESVGEKLDGYAKKLAPLNQKIADSLELDKSEKKKLRMYSINSKALGQVEAGLDNMIVTLSTCDRLIPLYNRDFEANKSNAAWLKRAVSRMYNKECTEDPLYEKLARAYAEASPSADSYSFVAVVLEKNGDSNGADQMRQKAFDLEQDPIKKAKYKLKFAQYASKKGQKSKARSLAREALSYNPNLGKAYLLIAGLYASSVNQCGKGEFEKRMVYVAALNKARRASAVDPSISVLASRYIRTYKGNSPDKKMIFTAGVVPGSSFTVKCWIGETVRVPK